MRNRHHPRLCRECQAPLAGHEGTCWRCGVEWATEAGPRTTLRLVASSDAAPEPAEVAVALQARA